MKSRTINIISGSLMAGFFAAILAAGLSPIRTIVAGAAVGAISGLLHVLVCKITKKEIV